MTIFKSKYYIIIPTLFFLCACDGEIETVDSDTVSTENLLAWTDVSSSNGRLFISVNMQSYVTKTRSVGLGESTETYEPHLVLSGGEYLEITYNGEVKRFTNGAESPFEKDFRLSNSWYDVTFYRNTGETIEIDSGYR